MATVRRIWRALVLWVGVLSVAVGLLAGGVAGAEGSGGCGVQALGAASRADPVCTHLVRVLAERVGLSCAIVTAVLVLTMVGLARLAEADPQPEARPGG
jgi:hypothetical protein